MHILDSVSLGVFKRVVSRWLFDLGTSEVEGLFRVKYRQRIVNYVIAKLGNERRKLILLIRGKTGNN